MSFIEWWFRMTGRSLPDPDDGPGEDEAEESCPDGGRGPYRKRSGPAPIFATQTVEVPFVATFRSRDDTAFTCRIVAVFELLARQLLTDKVQDGVLACLTGRIRRGGGMGDATEYLAVIREHIDVTCLGILWTPREVLACLPEGVNLAHVRLTSVTVDSGLGRPLTFRFG